MLSQNLLSIKAQKTTRRPTEDKGNRYTSTIYIKVNNMKLSKIILEYKPGIDVKGISLTYTDYGSFYGAYLYPLPKTANLPLGTKREKIGYLDAVEYIKGLTGLELPRSYDYDALDKIVDALKEKGYEASHDDAMDVS